MDIDLYINSVYCGFFPREVIEERLDEYRSEALSMVEYIDWDEVILYAVLAYDSQTSGFVAADLMLIRVPYSRYVELCKKLSGTCRLLFVRGK